MDVGWFCCKEKRNRSLRYWCVFRLSLRRML